MKVSVIVPAYNEEKNIIQGLTELIITLDFLELDYEIIVVVDGDPSTLLVTRTLEKPKLKVLTYEKRSGKGHALMHGFKNSTGDVIIFWDAGTQISQESLKLAWRIFSFSGADVVVGSKCHAMSKVNYPLIRHVLSRICRLASLILFRLNVADTQTGLKIYKREILDKIVPKIKTRGYAIDIEMLVAARSIGYTKIFESPVDLSAFKFGGAVNYKAVRQVAFDMIKTLGRLQGGYYEKSLPER
jgi:dolichol-phosphate mannosyltransferase